MCVCVWWRVWGGCGGLISRITAYALTKHEITTHTRSRAKGQLQDRQPPLPPTFLPTFLHSLCTPGQGLLDRHRRCRSVFC